MVEKVRRYVHLFTYNTTTCMTEGRRDRNGKTISRCVYASACWCAMKTSWLDRFWMYYRTDKNKKLSWCWQTRATQLEVSQGHHGPTIPFVRQWRRQLVGTWARAPPGVREKFFPLHLCRAHFTAILPQKRQLKHQKPHIYSVVWGVVWFGMVHTMQNS